MSQYFRFLPLLLLTFLCTCDRAQNDDGKTVGKQLFSVRTDTGITFSNQLRETEDFNIVEYLYYYNGGGVAATDINGDGLPDLYFTSNQGPNKYYINEGDFRFRDATETGGVAGAGQWTTGISVVDINGDDRMDLYVCNVSGYKGLTGRNELFVQQADGTFTEEAEVYGLDFAGFNTQAYWFDYDLDGDLDMYLLRHSVHNDATYGTAESRNIPDSLAGDLLLRNDLKSFTDVSTSAGLYSSKIGYGLSATIADFDANGYPDIYVCNDFSENDYYYLNQGDGTFSESVRALTGHTSNFSMGSDAGDFDADGRTDLFSLDMRPWDETTLKATMSADQPNVYNLKRELGYHHQLPHNALQWNRGGGNFSEIAEMAGVAASDWSWSCIIEDFDLDGKQDIFVANGIERRPNSLDYLKFISSRLARTASNLQVIGNMPGGHTANRLFRQTGQWAFEDVAPEWGLNLVGSSTGAAVADFDNDGDLDLVLNNLNAPATVYENTVNPEVPRATRNLHPFAAQRGMLSQSGPALVRQPEAQSEAAPFYPVRPSGIVRKPERGSYFDEEPLAVYGVEDNVALYRFVGEFDGNTFWAESTGTAARYYIWSDGVFRKLDVDKLPTGLRSWEGAISGLQAQNDYLGSDGFMRFKTKADSILRLDTDFPVDGDIQSVIRLKPGPQTDSLFFGKLGLNTVLGAPSPESPVRLYLTDVDDNGKIDPIFTYVRNGRETTVADKDELTGQIPSLRRNNLSYTEFARRSFSENIPLDNVTPYETDNLEHLVLWVNDANEYVVDTLPRPTQITTLNAVMKVPQGILLGGNKLEVLPRIGRQDAAALQLWQPDGTVSFVDLGGERNRLEVRQLLRLDLDHVLVVVHEGEHLILEL